LHGGSYLFGSSKTTHCEVMARLAFETGIPVIAPDFRLLPEHPYPAQLKDALAVYQALLRDENAAERLIVVGDSSGGNLALSLALELRKQGIPLPRALGLLSPWVDLEMPGRSFVENDRYDFGTREVLTRHARAFAGSFALSDPGISPTHAELTGLCPCFIIVGELEIPRDDILSFHSKLQQAGVSTQLHVAPQMTHNPPAMAGLHPEADIAIRKLASFVLEQL
jgi:acetyl esterase/lipase